MHGEKASIQTIYDKNDNSKSIRKYRVESIDKKITDENLDEYDTDEEKNRKIFNKSDNSKNNIDKNADNGIKVPNNFYCIEILPQYINLNVRNNIPGVNHAKYMLLFTNSGDN